MSKTNRLVHEIHVSEIRAFKKCRFAHQLKYVGQYYPKITAKPLEFGTAYHAAKEVYYDPQTNGYPVDARKELAILKFVAVCKEQEEALGNSITAEQRADYQERIQLGMGMLEYYFGEIAPVEDANFEPLAVEQEFSVPIVDPSTGKQLYCSCDRCAERWSEANPQKPFTGLPVMLEGKIDLILKDKRTGKVWVLDWKTAARIEDNHEWLELDEQIIDYLIALMLLNYDVAGFMYHQQLKSFPQVPKKNKAKRLGRWYSVDKNQDTSYDLYVEEVASGDPEGLADGLYDNFLDYLRNVGKEFYHRESVRKTNDMLRLAYIDLYNTAREMTNPAKIIFASPSKYNCLYCEFMQVCIGRASLADYEYTLESMFEQKAPYYER